LIEKINVQKIHEQRVGLVELLMKESGFARAALAEQEKAVLFDRLQALRRYLAETGK
jgi:hypothetical protein